MLEKLDSINWRKLKHAYGSASDVPKQIRALTSQDPKIRKDTIWSLCGNIFHQGTRYQATPYAIPFLFELLQSDEVKEKENIIFLLIKLALGYENAYLPEGLNIDDFIKEIADLDADMTPQERRENKSYGFVPQALLDSYQAVKKGVPVFISLLNDKDILVNRASVYALAWFPELAPDLINHVKNKLKNYSEDKDIANAIITIGLLNKSSKLKSDISFLEEYLNSNSDLISTCTAISLADNPLSTQVLDKLINTITINKEFKHVDYFPFNDGNLISYICSVLSLYGGSNKDKIIPALAEALKYATPYQSLDITRALLELVNDNRNVKLKDAKLEDLNELEILALKAVAEYGGWKINDKSFGNYGELMRYIGLPDSKEKLIEYLKRSP